MSQDLSITVTGVSGGDKLIQRTDFTPAFADIKTHLDNIVNGDQVFENLLLIANTLLTISGGAVTVTQATHTLAAESGTADDLDTINGTAEGRIYVLRADTGDTITLKHGTGNIDVIGGSDLTISGDNVVMAISDGTTVSVVGGGAGSNSQVIVPETILDSSHPAAITMDNIPQTFHSLRVETLLRDYDGGSAGPGPLHIKFNNDATATLYYGWYFASIAGTYATGTQERLGSVAYFDAVLGLPRVLDWSGARAAWTIQIWDYASSRKKLVRAEGNFQIATSAAKNYRVSLMGTYQYGAGGISRIDLIPPNAWEADCVYALYGEGAAV